MTGTAPLLTRDLAGREAAPAGDALETDRAGFVACWSAKGGAGTSVVAAALAVRAARAPSAAVLVGTSGDAPAVLGLREPDGPGLADWMRSGGTGFPGHVEAAPGLRLIHRGGGPLEADAVDDLAGLLARDPRSVVVDCGTAPDGARAALVERAGRSLLVTRPCYLGLRRAVSSSLPRPTGVVVVREPERALSAKDIEQALDIPVVAEVPYDPAVARVVDAGLLAARMPRVLDAALAAVDGLGAPSGVGRSTSASPWRAPTADGLDPPEASAW